MINEVVIRYATTDDIPAIDCLARQVWPIAYGDTIDAQKLQYMLQLIYNPAALKEQMMNQHHQFLMAEIEQAPVGFASFSGTKEQGIYRLHKLYIKTDLQSKGLSKASVEAVITEIQALGTRLGQLSKFKRQTAGQNFSIILKNETTNIY
jgi:diamine N-acetyltransferase